ncbi:MAG: leucine-rich repeat domain-containing protein, partial [Clostridia bacterium]|nr:leucine-rich repeat domain-containing protein [Clostridia bacterium]
STTSIGEGAFAECHSLKSVSLGKGLTHIFGGAFYSCTSLTEIVIPANVKMINDAIRATWTGYNYYGVFDSCTSLEKVIIGDADTDIDLTTIGSDAFQFCTSLTEVYIGNAVGTIGGYAFDGCTSLSTIQYAGDADGWNAISKGTNWDLNTGAYIVLYN